MERDFNNIRLPWPDWSVVRILGRGSFGRVYEIQKTKDGRIQKAALKIIKIPFDIGEVYSLRAEGLNEQEIDIYFRNEAIRLENEIVLMEELQTASNIVAIKDSQILRKENGEGYELHLMMELLTSLDKYTYGANKVKTMTVEDVIKIGCDVCNALLACEVKNIIHRDIKPSNIFVTEYGEYKLGDFGVSRQKEHTHTNMSLQGTVNYMAPEIYRNEKHYDHTVDIYSLGLVLYRLLNWGRLPFVRKDGEVPTYEENADALTKRMEGNAAFPDPALGGKNLANVLRKACSYRPADRYQRAEEFRKDLLKCEFSLSEKELKTEIIKTDTEQTERIRRKTVSSYRKSEDKTPFSYQTPETKTPYASLTPENRITTGSRTPENSLSSGQPEKRVEDATAKKKSVPETSTTTPPPVDTPQKKNPKWFIAGAAGICAVFIIGMTVGYFGNRGSNPKEVSVAKEELSPTPEPTVTMMPTAVPTPVQTSFMMDLNTDSSVLGNEELKKKDITTIKFLNDTSAAPENSWDASDLQNESVLAWSEENSSGKYTLYIAQNGGVRIKNGSGLFRYFYNLTEIDLENADVSHVTDMSYMFAGCQNLEYLDLTSFDTSNVTNMNSMFRWCAALTYLDLSSFDCSNVSDARNMFGSCRSLTSYYGALNFPSDANIESIYG